MVPVLLHALYFLPTYFPTASKYFYLKKPFSAGAIEVHCFYKYNSQIYPSKLCLNNPNEPLKTNSMICIQIFRPHFKYLFDIRLLLNSNNSQKDNNGENKCIYVDDDGR